MSGEMHMNAWYAKSVKQVLGELETDREPDAGWSAGGPTSWRASGGQGCCGAFWGR